MTICKRSVLSDVSSISLRLYDVVVGASGFRISPSMTTDFSGLAVEKVVYIYLCNKRILALVLLTGGSLLGLSVLVSSGI